MRKIRNIAIAATVAVGTVMLNPGAAFALHRLNS